MLNPTLILNRSASNYLKTKTAIKGKIEKTLIKLKLPPFTSMKWMTVIQPSCLVAKCLKIKKILPNFSQGKAPQNLKSIIKWIKMLASTWKKRFLLQQIPPFSTNKTDNPLQQLLALYKKKFGQPSKELSYCLSVTQTQRGSLLLKNPLLTWKGSEFQTDILLNLLLLNPLININKCIVNYNLQWNLSSMRTPY